MLKLQSLHGYKPKENVELKQAEIKTGQAVQDIEERKEISDEID